MLKMTFRLRIPFLSSFGALNLTQFFSAFNDNIYKLLLVFFLIGFKGSEHSNTILSLAGVIFVVPFLLFAALAGALADRYSKRSLIVLTRFSELFIVAGGVLSFALQSTLGLYLVLFLMAMQSALFSPSKYGIVPELVPRERVSRSNGLMTATTYLAIIVGTFFASFLVQLFDYRFVWASLVCLVIAILGFVSSLCIKKTLPQAEDKPVPVRFISQIVRSLKMARRVRYLLLAILFGAYFLCIGAYTQLNIIPYAMQSLGVSEVQGGYLFLLVAVGIGIGAFLSGRIAGRDVELGMTPLASLVLTLLLWGLFFFAHLPYLVVPLLLFLGMSGGFYIVPIDAFIQVASPHQDRGQNVAAYNFLSFTGAIVAALLIALFGNVLEWSAAEGFLAMGLVTFVVTVLLFLLLTDQVVRLLLAKVVGLARRARVLGAPRVYEEPLLLVGRRRSWVDTVVMMATLPRLTRYVVPIQGRFIRSRSFFYRLLRFLPIDMEHFSSLGGRVFTQIKRELERGSSVCVMQPEVLEGEALHNWRRQLHQLHRPLKVIPVTVERPEMKEEGYLAQFLSLFKQRLTVRYGDPLEF